MRVAAFNAKENIEADDKRCEDHTTANDTRKGFRELLPS